MSPVVEVANAQLTVQIDNMNAELDAQGSLPVSSGRMCSSVLCPMIPTLAGNTLGETLTALERTSEEHGNYAVEVTCTASLSILPVQSLIHTVQSFVFPGQLCVCSARHLGPSRKRGG